MIINIRGTGGAGKTHLVQQVMARYATKTPVMEPGRKQPIGYRLTREATNRPLHVIGHYETPCGGCDTISGPGSMDRIFAIAKAAHADGHDVLMEGVILGDDVRRTAETHHAGIPIMVVAIDATREEFLAGIQSRRDARGDDRPLDPTNTLARVPRLQQHIRKLRGQGVNASWRTRPLAEKWVMEVLGWE